MFAYKKIKIVVSDNNNHTAFADKFCCSECREALTCKPEDSCKLYNYISQRLPNSSFDENNVITIKTDDYDKALTLVKRAIKLRKHRIR